MKKMCVIFEVNDNADLSKVTLTFKDKNGNNPDAIIYRNLRAVNVDDRFSTVTEFADRCRECGAKYGKLLKQQPCEDAISRQAAIDAIESWLSCDDYNDAERHIMRAMQSVLYDLPPVKPTEKVGHWILTDDDFVYCSECEDSYYPRPIDASWYYCPHCGAKMVEPQERSDKE